MKMKIEGNIKNSIFWRVLVLVIILNFHFSNFNSLRAQVAGLNTLSLLQMPSSARSAGLGFNYLSIYDPVDVHIGIDNPSLISTSYDKRLGINYVAMFGGGNFASVNYGRDFHRFGTFLFGIQYNGYGRFEGFDENELPQGTFSASDIALHVGWGLNVDSCFSIGASFRPILSQYERYTAFAVAFSVAGTYVSPNKQFAATVQARNIGAQIATFNGSSESLPFDLSATLSYKLSKAPFRVFFALDNLTRWNLGYDDALNTETEIDPITGQEISKPWYNSIGDALDLVARHAIIGLELNVAKVLYARVGYRYRQAAEMDATERTSFNASGFSYGFGLRTKKFEFSYARNMRNYFY